MRDVKALVYRGALLAIKYFSTLVALTMVNATLATLFFLPSVLVLFPRLLWRREKQTAARWRAKLALRRIRP